MVFSCRILTAVATCLALLTHGMAMAETRRERFAARAAELGITLGERYFDEAVNEESAQQKVHAPEAPWKASVRDGDVMYFLYASPARIERYDLAANAWLATVNLSDVPTDFAVDSQYYFIAFSRRLVRTDHDGANETHLGNTASDIRSVLAADGFVFCRHDEVWDCRSASTGSVLSESSDWYDLPEGASISSATNTIIGRTAGIFPSDIIRMTYTDAGILSSPMESPYHGDFPGASWAEFLAGGSRVVDSSGTAYAVSDLTYIGSMGGAIADLALYGDFPIVRRQNRLEMLSRTFGPVGSVTPDYTILDYTVQGTDVVTFHRDGNAIVAEKIPVSAMDAPDPTVPLDPTDLAYTPDYVLFDGNGIVYILHKQTMSVFRWSVGERRYLESLPLTEVPSFMAYSAANKSLYFAYGNGRVTRYPTAAHAAEEFMTNLPTGPMGLSTAGEYIFTCDSSGAWATHRTFLHTGEQVAERDWNYYSRTYVWSPAMRRMYHFRDDTSPNDIHSEEILPDGKFGSQGESLQHGGVDVSLPLSVSPDGARVLTGGGVIRDGRTLDQVDALSNSINAATWVGSGLYTARLQGSGTQIQRWGNLYGVTGTMALPGTPIDLFSTGTTLLAMTEDGPYPRFHVLNTDLQLQFQSATPTPTPTPTVTPSPTATPAPTGTVAPSPTATPASLPPSAPGIVRTFSAVLGRPSIDPEGGPVSYLYTWSSSDGEEVIDGPTQRTWSILFDGDHGASISDYEPWTVRVVPIDASGVEGQALTGRFIIYGGQTVFTGWVLN